MLNRPSRAVLIAGLVGSIVVASALPSLIQSAAAAPSSPGSSVAGAFVSTPPTRLLDTRSGLGGAALGPAGTLTLAVTGGASPVPAGVSAVVLNVTVASATASGFITVWDGGVTKPLASNLNFSAGQTVPNLVVAPVSSGGKVGFYNGSTGTTQLIADVEGYYLAGTPSTPGAFVATTPTRLLDTRQSLGATTPGPSGQIRLQVTGGSSPVPAGVSAVVMNVTVAAPTGDGYITTWADGSTRPTASNLNFSAGQTVPNLVVAPVSASGGVDLFNGSGGSTPLIADVEGYFVAGSPQVAGSFTSTPPTRLLDTRTGLGGSAVGAQSVLTLAVTGGGSPVPAGASAVVMNVTVTEPTAAGYLTAYADGATPPTASNLNFVAGQTVPNLVVVPLSAAGKVDLFNGAAGSTQLIADVVGYYLATPGAVTGVTALPSTTSVALDWVDPVSTTFSGVVIRRAVGSTPPASPTAGTAITTTGPSATAWADNTAAPGTQYAYALFAVDSAGDFTAGASIVTTTIALSGPTPVQQRTSGNVTADELPTVQIDGVVWSQAVLGNTVYAGGQFANARPAGAAPGTNLTPRTNLLAYDITTGNLITSFDPTIDGEVQVVRLSPDGSRLYIGGAFTTVNGQSRYRLAAFDTATGQLLPSFAPIMGSQVTALAVTNTTVYAGGFFNSVNGVSRTRLAAVDAVTGALLPWAPTADDAVNALQLTPDGGKVVVAGDFTDVNTTAVYGLGAVDPTSGASVSWLANATVRAYNVPNSVGAGFFSLSADATTVYATAWNYAGGGNFEGSVAMNPSDGSIRWMEDCHGDTYDTASLNGVVYTVSHAHYCGTLNGWPGNPTNFSAQERHAVAFTAATTGTLGHNTTGEYPDFYGKPAPSLINWFPDFVDGTYTSSKQAAWSLAGNSQYLVVGGEFPDVNSVAQQGLVRFAVPSIAPDAERPRNSGPNFPVTATSTVRGTVTVSWTANWDRDDTTLYYKVIRDGNNSVPVDSLTANSQWWNEPTLSFTDAGLLSGSTHTYTVSAADADGNLVYSTTAQVTVS